jgi:hypothetical protein
MSASPEKESVAHAFVGREKGVFFEFLYSDIDTPLGATPEA